MEGFSLFNNSFAPSTAPGSAAEYGVVVVFWPRFRALLETRSDRRPLVQQADSEEEVSKILEGMPLSGVTTPKIRRMRTLKEMRAL